MTKIILLLASLLISSCAWLKEDISNEKEAQNEATATTEKIQEVAEAEPKNNQKTEKSKQEEYKATPGTKNTKSSASNHYGILLDEQSLQIKKLRSEIDFLNEELFQLKAQAQVWENPFSIYNKEIVLEGGTTIYGKIIYQDQEVIKVETLIGGLTIARANIIKVTENVVEIVPKDSLSNVPMRNFVKEGSIIEIQENFPNTEIERQNYSQKANLIILGSIYEKTDENGNTILSGELKNIGKARADFAKINFLFRMNWRGDTKPMTCFVKGAVQDLGNGVVSDASIEPESIGTFELFIPKSFGTFISYSYSLDWEQYE